MLPLDSAVFDQEISIVSSIDVSALSHSSQQQAGGVWTTGAKGMGAGAGAGAWEGDSVVHKLSKADVLLIFEMLGKSAAGWAERFSQDGSGHGLLHAIEITGHLTIKVNIIMYYVI